MSVALLSYLWHNKTNMMDSPELFTDMPIGLMGAAALAWLIVGLLYLIFSLILVYHWRQYATSQAVARTTLWWYFVSTGACMVGAAIVIPFV